ncbi:NUDIX domain-containing protein [Legionella gresilensis]|uniref:NUDIX domain-containing protein n=1 Tax=Legionella gresilensis TaxID=91823 RepID=UPI001040F60C|nr:NUDIX domain-containing protein [Legionella gresilensis]
MMRFYHLTKNALFSILAKRTIGVRALLIQDDEILLVKHTYQLGWYTIGGGVEPGETPYQALQRELKEEVGVSLLAPAQLFAVYYSNNEKRDDYIVFYICQALQQEISYSAEIAEQQWFKLDHLPLDISPATKKRIEEYLGKRAVSEYW